jgi:hypothetical protein
LPSRAELRIVRVTDPEAMMDVAPVSSRRTRAGRRPARLAAVLLAAMTAGSAVAQEFPFERELLLDVDPMRGSRRIPGIDIAANGNVTIDLWCDSVPGQLVVAGDTVTLLLGTKTMRECPPDRAQGDQDLLAALSQVSKWRWEDGLLVLDGASPLRFRPQTN